MDQKKNHGEKYSLLKKIKYFFKPQIRLDARLLDFMRDHPEIAPDSDSVKAPPGEFQKIMAEMDRRGIKPVVRRQLALKSCLSQAGMYMKKPVVVALCVVLILGGTSVGAAAKKSYNYRMRERDAGKSDIVWNNDEYVMTEEGIDEIYREIEEKLSIKPLKFIYMPIGMNFEEFKISGDHANIKFSYSDKAFNYVQSKKPVTSSNNVVSDRTKYKETYNEWLDIFIPIEKNVINTNEVEYSAKFDFNGCYFYVFGIMEEDNFELIVQNLAY